jgi:hypothetical protein
MRGSRVCAFVAACGITASIFAYMASFSGSLLESVFPWGILLVLGLFALFISMYALEYPASRAPTFFLKGFARGMPTWVAPCSRLLQVIGIAQLVWFAAHSGWGVPTILDGQYVLDSRGQILKVLTKAEYLTLKEAEQRMFAAMVAAFYFVPMMYWWFRGNEQATD